jgi:hypothetical protein
MINLNTALGVTSDNAFERDAGGEAPPPPPKFEPSGNAARKEANNRIRIQRQPNIARRPSEEPPGDTAAKSLSTSVPPPKEKTQPRTAAGRKIFISYRRDDAASEASSIRDKLVEKFGKNNVFMDVDDLVPGRRFDEELAEALDECGVFLAVIGPNWLSQLKAKASAGEHDYVREEIRTALQRRVALIPVRVGIESRMPALPTQRDLPQDIRDLAMYQAQSVTHEHRGRDTFELIKVIRQLTKKPPSWPITFSTGMTMLAIAYLAGAYFMHWPPFF